MKDAMDISSKCQQVEAARNNLGAAIFKSELSHQNTDISVVNGIQNSYLSIASSTDSTTGKYFGSRLKLGKIVHSSTRRPALKMSSDKTVVLAYSGGLDTSCILVWLIENGFDVIAYMANLGQEEDFDEARNKAMKLGAKEVVILDVREQLVEDFAWPAVQADLIYEDRYMLGSSIARPCIVRGMVRVADKFQAGYVSHGATGKGNDQVRFEMGVYSLRPALKVIAPWRDPKFYNRFQGRADLFEYAKQHDIPLPVTPKAPWSIDANILHVSYESGVLEEPAAIPPDGIYQMTADPEKAPDTPSIITVEFSEGNPTSVCLHETAAGNGEKSEGPLASLELANKLGSIHGIGRIDIVENRFIGLKSRGLYETPGLTIFREAHLDLQALCLDREVSRLKRHLSEEMARMVYNGYWFSPECDFVRKCIKESQKSVTGNVTLKLYKGAVYVLSRDSPTSLYNQKLVSMDVHGDFDPCDAGGFIKVNAVRLQEYQRIRNSKELQPQK